MKTGFTVNEWVNSHEGHAAATWFSFVGISGGMKRFRTGNGRTEGKTKCHVSSVYNVL